MNKLRMLCLALVLTLLLPYICYAQDNTDQIEIPIEDVTSTAPEFFEADEWALPELTQAYELGLTTKKSMQKMSSSITREEFCELAVLFYEKYSGKEAAIPASNPFKDTTNPTVLKAVGLGITDGFTPTTFNPAGLISKQDMAVMIVRAMKACGIDTSVTTTVDKFTDYYKISSHAQTSISLLQENGILKGVTSGTVNGTVRYKLDPLGNISKQEAIILLKRTFEYADMVRNASKWGPEVYIPKLEVGDGYILSDKRLIYENDQFDLEIAPGTPVDINFEQRMYDIFKYIQEITDLKNITGRKFLIVVQLGGSYSEYSNYDTLKYCGLLFYNQSMYFAPDTIFNYTNEFLIANVYHNIISHYNCYGDMKSKNVLVDTIGSYCVDMIQQQYLVTEYSTLKHYYSGYDKFQQAKFENALNDDVEAIFKGINELNSMEFDTKYYDTVDYYKKTYVLLFNYINKIYGKDILKQCITDLVTQSRDVFGDIDEIILYFKKHTKQSLFSDFKAWYLKNKEFHIRSSADNIAGLTDFFFTETDAIKDFHPYGINKKDEYSQYNRVVFFMGNTLINSYKFISDTLTIDYKTAIALTQLNGLEMKGISLKQSESEYYKALGITYDIYDAFDNVIFKGPTAKLHPGIQLKNGFLLFYGGVKIVYHAPVGTTFFHEEVSDMTSPILVKQN